MATIAEVKKLMRDVEESTAAYRAVANTASVEALREQHEKVKGAQKALSDAICEGAKACKCGSEQIHGMVQPSAHAPDISFEVGCLACPAKSRGGLLPRHVVEAWNEEHAAQ